MDGYAIAYAVALGLTAIAALIIKCPERIYAATLLVAAWMVTIALQNGVGALALPIQFGLLDLALVVCFGVIARIYQARWAWWVSACHVAMLVAHLAYQISPKPSREIYLSVLAVMGFASMALICAPLIGQGIRSA